VAESLDRGRNALLTAVGQAFVLVGATAIGIVAAARLPTGPRVDAYFAANQVFMAALFLGQGIRTTVPGLELGGVVTRRVLRQAVAVLAVVATVILAVVCFIGPSLLPADVRDGFSRDLAILTPGAALQIGGGYVAARLAVAGRFAGVALAYGCGTALNAVVLAVLIHAHGASALAPAALCGTILATGLILVHGLRSRGTSAWGGVGRAPVGAGVVADVALPTPLAPTTEPGAATAALGTGPAVGRLLLGVVPALAAQLVVMATVLVSASLQDGGAALFAYAFLATNAVGTLAVTPISIVLAGDLGVTWDRSLDTLAVQLRKIVKLSTAIVVPTAAVLVLIGRPVGTEVLVAQTPADIQLIFEMVAIITPSLVLTAAGLVGLVAAITLDRLALLAKRLGVMAAGVVLTSVALGLADASLLWAAALAAVWSAVAGIVALSVVFGRRTFSEVVAVVGGALAIGLPGAVVLAGSAAFNPPLVWGVVSTAAVIAIQAAWLRRAERPVFDALAGAVARR
jgi:hypothetical protein